MTAARREFLTAGVALVGAVYFPQHGMAQTNPKLSGAVLKKDNSGIGGVLVTAYRGGVKIGENTTPQDGSYTIDFQSGAPIDTIRYEETNYIVGVVNDLCGAKSHMINKTLYRRGNDLTAFEGLESLSALERVFYIDTVNKIEVAVLKDKYATVLSELKKTIQNPPPTLLERLYAVMKLYQLGGSR